MRFWHKIRARLLLNDHRNESRAYIRKEIKDDMKSSKRHGKRRANARKRAWMRFYMYRAAEVTLCAIIGISIVMIAGIAVRSARTKLLNHQLSERRAELNEAVAAVEATPIAQTPTEEPMKTPPEVTAAAPTPTPTAAPIVKTTTYHRTGGTALPHMEELYYENRDLIGWIEIPGVLDLPVMYRDNAYYLTHDFYEKTNASGTIFLDVNHKFKENTQNLLLHGHNMKDGTMFGHLVRYMQDVDYYKRNALVNYDTLWESQQYVIFAILRVSLDTKSEGFFNYFSHPTFETDEAFDAYVREAQLRSMYAIPIDVKPTDALLTLSTCIDDERLVIVCRRVRETETRSELKRLANLAVRQ